MYINKFILSALLACRRALKSALIACRRALKVPFFENLTMPFFGAGGNTIVLLPKLGLFTIRFNGYGT